jgi:hypothetical protein
MGAGGKAGGSGQTYNYYGTMAGGVCVGPVDELVSIIVSGQEVWPGGKAWAVGLAISAGSLYVYDAQSWKCTTNHTSSTANAPGSGLYGWTEYTFPRGTDPFNDFSLTTSDATHLGVLRFYWGTAAQTVDPYLQAANNDGGTKGNLGSGDTHPDYKGICYIVLIDFLFGQEVQSGPNVEVVVRRKPNQTLITGSAANVTDGQCNIAAALAEILTDKNLLGLPTSVVDATSFQAVADYLLSNEQLYGASILLDTSEQVRRTFDALMAMIDGYVRFNASTKKIELGIYQHGSTPGSYTTLTADQLTKRPKFTTTSWQGTISRAVVRYNSRQLNYQQTSEQVDDPRAFFVLGVVRDQALDRPHLVRQAQARIHGRETLRVIGHAVTKGELEVRREFGRSIRAGDFVFVDVDLEPGGSSVFQFFRVMERKIPATGPISLMIVADNTLAAVPWNNPAAPVLQLPEVVPPITSYRILEVPTALSGEHGAIIVLAERPNNLLVGNNVYCDTDTAGTFQLLGNANNFAAKATLHTAVAATDTTLDVDVVTSAVDAGYFTNQYATNEAINDTMLAFLVATSAGQVAESGGYALMEICSVSVQTLASAGRYTLTVLRGRKNTTAQAFATSGTEVWLMPAALLTFFTANLFDTIRANRLLGATPATLQFRFCPQTFTAALALADAANHAFQFPLKSASVPSLTLTTPGSFSQTFAGATLPVRLKVAGTWATLDNSLVKIEVRARLSSESADRPILTQNFAACGSKDFNTLVQFDTAGSWTVKMIATDSTGIVSERDLSVVVTSTSAIKCAVPQIFDKDGLEILNINGTLPSATTTVGAITGVISGTQINVPLVWEIKPSQFVPFGFIRMRCATPGATIRFKINGAYLASGQITRANGFPLLTYDDATLLPFNMLIAGATDANGFAASPSSNVNIWFYASAPGFANSDGVACSIPLFKTP